MAERVQSKQRRGPVDTDSRLRDLMATYQQPLLRYARRLTGDAWRAEDVVQEAFLRAWTHLDRLTADRGSVLGWLRRVVHNLVMDGYRMKNARPTEVVNEVFDLMIELGASDEQLDFPILYAIGRQGIVRNELADTNEPANGTHLANGPVTGCAICRM